jgi:two-component sensor histidine kinase
MAHASDHTAADATSEVFPLGRREIEVIFIFWALFALVTAGSRLLDPRGPGVGSPVAIAFAWLAVVQALCWALLTPPLFILASRLGARHVQARQVVLILVACLAAALTVDVIVATVREQLLTDDMFNAGRRVGDAARRGRPRRFIDPFQILNDLIVGVGVISAGIARDRSLRYRARQEEATRLAAETARLHAQLAEARLDALRRQLDPHFLFNTLNAVSSLVERDPRGVRRMIARLSDLLRHSIEGASTPEITLERELELLARYLDIMQVRFQGRLEVETRIDPATRGGLVPNLILQPLVENAIKHGIERSEGGGRIVVTAERRNGDVVLQVSDDGPGPEGAVAGSGVGVRNTRERLAELYGTRQQFVLRRSDEGRTIAEVVLPYHEQPLTASART